MRAAVIDGDGEIHASLRDATPHTERETEDILVTLIAKLAATHDGVGRRAGSRRVRQPGPAAGDVRAAPGLAGCRCAERGSRRGCRLPVVMDHDVNSAAGRRYQHGASAGAHIALLIALGTGIGAGLDHRRRDLPWRTRCRAGTGSSDGGAERPAVPVRQAGLLGAVLLGHRSGRDGPGTDDDRGRARYCGS